jgi:hypothetical protein
MAHLGFVGTKLVLSEWLGANSVRRGDAETLR